MKEKMEESKEKVKEKKNEGYDREFLQLRINSDRTSQQGRVYRYLKDQGSAGKSELIKKAINAFYLVHALNECGTRSREDVKEVAQRCIKQLLSQIEEIKIESGVKMELNVTDLGKSDDDSVELEESDEEDDDPNEETWVQESEFLSSVEKLSEEEFEAYCDAI